MELAGFGKHLVNGNKIKWRFLAPEHLLFNFFRKSYLKVSKKSEINTDVANGTYHKRAKVQFQIRCTLSYIKMAKVWI